MLFKTLGLGSPEGVLRQDEEDTVNVIQIAHVLHLGRGEPGGKNIISAMAPTTRTVW